MIYDIKTNLIATLIAGIISWVVKRVYRYFKNAENDIQKPKHSTPRRTLRKQFFAFLFIFVVSWPAALMFRNMVLKILSGIFAFYSFLFTWGAFDVAMEFYPPDDVVNIPADDAPKDNRNK